MADGTELNWNWVVHMKVGVAVASVPCHALVVLSEHRVVLTDIHLAFICYLN